MDYLHCILSWPRFQFSPSWEEWLLFLEKERRENGIRPVAFVLMGTHFHLLCQGQPRSEKWWEERGMELCYFEVINPKYALHTYRYIIQNPLRAKLCQRVENYPYHSLHLKQFSLPLLRSLKLARASLLPYHLQSSRAELSWLNGKENLYLSNSYSRISS